MGGIVYALCDPASGDVRYVGVTEQKLSDRLDQHVYNARAPGRRRSTELADWIRSVGRPTAVSLSAHRRRDCLYRAERRWIRRFRRAGSELLNATDGGAGAPGLVRC